MRGKKRLQRRRRNTPARPSTARPPLTCSVGNDEGYQLAAHCPGKALAQDVQLCSILAGCNGGASVITCAASATSSPDCRGLTKQQQHIERKLYAASSSKQFRTRAQLINKIGFSTSFAYCKSASGSMTVWPSGLRWWLKAPFRKGVGSTPAARACRVEQIKRSREPPATESHLSGAASMLRNDGVTKTDSICSQPL